MAATRPTTHRAQPGPDVLTDAERAALEREIAELEGELALRRALLQVPSHRSRPRQRRLDPPIPTGTSTRGSREDA